MGRPRMVLVQIRTKDSLGRRISLDSPRTGSNGDESGTKTIKKGPCYGNLTLSLKLSEKVLMHNSETVVVNSDFRPQ